MSRRTYTATVSVTVESKAEVYSNNGLAEDIREAVFAAIRDKSMLGPLAVIMTVEAGARG